MTVHEVTRNLLGLALGIIQIAPGIAPRILKIAPGIITITIQQILPVFDW